MKNRFSLILVIVFAVVGLTACSMSTPTMVGAGKMTVRDKFVTKTFDVQSFDDNEADAMAQEIVTKGHGSVNLNVSYFIEDKDSKWNFKNKAEKIKNKFVKSKIDNVKVVVIPVEKAEQGGKLVISYKTRVAEVPDECTEMTGNKGAGDMADMKNYKISCGYKMNLSKMIANPDDLLGRADNENIESRRAGATVEKYKTGEPNGELDGYQASKIGQ